VHHELALLDRARKLDMDALAQIHDLYYEPIFRYVAFRVSDRHVAEDLTSDVFTRFLAAVRERRAPHSTLRGWLYSVAANVVNDYHRKYYRASYVELDETMVSMEVGPEQVAEDALTRADLRRAVAGLTEDQQNVIALRFGDEMPIQEVARTMGKTEGAIKQLQARAIAALARKLSPGIVE
jgi:RNA polymerase sigma-70 factor (ECF subfamily)